MRLLHLVLIVGLLGACAPADDPDGTDPAEEPADLGEAGTTIEGRLTGDPQLEGGCVWLETDDGPYEVLWPGGYSDDASIVALRDQEGDVIAREGDRVRVTGEVAEDMMSVCQVGTLFNAVNVEVVEST